MEWALIDSSAGFFRTYCTLALYLIHRLQFFVKYSCTIIVYLICNHELLNFLGSTDNEQKVGAANSTVPILLSSVRCKGKEDDILECRHSEFNEFDTCSHADDADVTCRGMYHAVADLGT